MEMLHTIWAGSVVNHLKEIGQLDNTLIYVMIGDNGASKEGTFNGTIDQGLLPRAIPEQQNIEDNLNKIGEIGTSAATNGNYPLGWAQAADTPYKDWKQDANSEGGTHNPLIIYWPKGIKDKGGIRPQYSHVIDILCGGPGCSDSFRRLLSGSSVLRLGCQRFWQAVEVDLVGDVAIDRQNHFIAS